MKILHTISDLGMKSGGTSTCTYDLVKGLNSSGICTDILSLDVKSKEDSLIGTDNFIKVVNNDSLTSFAFSNNYRRFLNNNLYDLYHVNGMWQYPVHVTCFTARKYKKPYIITPHGMLYPQSLTRSKWKKRALMNLCFREDLTKSTCLHATCEEEMIHLRNLGFKMPIAIIPNPSPTIDYKSYIKTNNENFTLGYLGRIHPIKNIDRLIYAWAKIQDYKNNSDFIIIGDGDTQYINFLKQEVKRLNLTNVHFIGFVNGRRKYELLSSLSCLGLVSDLENFGMVVTEALQMGVPVMASKGTPWQSLINNNCGWWIDNDIESITSTLIQIMSMDNEKLFKMGENGRKMVLDNYTIDSVASKMGDLYKWILGEIDKPNFVIL